MTREERILSLEPLVRNMARDGSFRYPIPFDEMLSAAWLGAIRAVDRYDPGIGSSLATWARYCIRSAILDYLRAQDYFNSGFRRGVVKRRGGAAPEIWQIGHAPAASDDPWEVCDERWSIGFLEAEARADLSNIMRRLGPLTKRERQVLDLLLERKTIRQKDLMHTLGLSEGRVAQLKSALVLKLRRAANRRSIERDVPKAA